MGDGDRERRWACGTPKLLTSTGGGWWANGTNHSAAISDAAQKTDNFTAVSMSQFHCLPRPGAGQVPDAFWYTFLCVSMHGRW